LPGSISINTNKIKYGEEMEKKDLDFKETLQTKLDVLEGARQIVLSTCSNNRVTSRVVDCACYNEKIYLLTWAHHTKCIQIEENPNVALCYDNLQIEGVAEIKGSPLIKSNTAHSNKYRAKQPEIYDKFAEYDGMVIIKVDIKSIHSWEDWQGESNGYFLDIVDISKRQAFRINAEDRKMY
jgi:general stress protein 26